MREITTNWNNAAYSLSATFVDKITGNAVTIPALNPMNHRSMIDSVESGGYIYQPDGIVADETTLALEVGDDSTVEITVTLDSVPVFGAPIRVFFDTPDIVSVDKTLAYTNELGKISFVLTADDDGSVEVFYECGGIAASTIVTVTQPA